MWVCRLTLNKLATRNALSELMLLKVADMLDKVEHNPKVKVIVLAAVDPYSVQVMIYKS